MNNKFMRGDKVTWRTGSGELLSSGVIADGPFDVENRESPAYVVHFPHTSRLIGEGVLDPDPPSRWVPCFGEHRKSETVWEKLETTT